MSALTKTLNIPQTLFRSATFERESINEEQRTVEMTVSSEEPYERYWGVEVLDHKTKSMRMDRFKKAAPLLFNHDRNSHIGRIVSAKVADGKLVVTAKFSSSQFAKEKWEDVKDGILRETSIGYSIYGMKLESEKDGVDTYRVTDWEPYEASLVTVPADFTVGVGRSAESERTKEIVCDDVKQVDNTSLTSNKAHMSEQAAPITEPKIDVVRERSDAIANERKRVSDIQDLSRHFAEKGIAGRKVNAEAVAAECIRDGKSVSDFQNACLRAELPEVKPLKLDEGNIGLNEKEKRGFSMLRACRLLAAGKPLDGLEREVSDEAAKQVGDVKERAFYLPPDISNFNLAATREFRAQNVGDFPAGGATVQNEYGSLIEMLRNKTVLGNLGVTMVTGLVGDFILPVQLTGTTFAWVSETGALSDSEATFGQKTLTPHRGGATTPYSTQFLAQSSLSAEQFFRNELAAATALGIDLAGLEGTGADGQPRGVKNTVGINATVTFGGAAVWADIVEFETGIAADNADIGSMGFALSASTVGKWKTAVKEANSGNGFLINENNGLINGYSYERTNQITGNIVFFGVWSQLLHAMWSTQEVIVDPYALKKSGQVEITMNTFHDFLVRQPLAFNISTDSGAQ